MTGSMNINSINMYSHFGSFCADGGRALSFLNHTITPMVDLDHKIILDFEGVRNMNASFSNALFGNLTRRYGKGFFDYISCVNLRENVKREISSGIKMAATNASPVDSVSSSIRFSEHIYT